MRALIVEPSRTLQAILRKLVGEAGFSVQVEASLADALTFIEHHPQVGLVLVEIQLLHEDDRFIQALGQQPGAAGRHVLLVAADDDQDHVNRALASGAHGHLPKPFTLDMLRRQIGIGAPAVSALRRPIGVLVVDDAALVRTLLSRIIEEDADLHLVGTAANGQEALEAIDALHPDIVTLDVEMPIMDGLATLTEIRRHYARLPVIMVSAVTEKGAAATLEALSRGANDYVTKPAALNYEEARERMKAEVVWRLKHFGGLSPHDSVRYDRAPHPLPAHGPEVPSGRIELIAIGVSTGGPEALALLLADLPRPLPVPVVIVQHMPAMFTRLLAERLTARGTLPVREAAAGEEIQAGVAYLAPGDFHMRVQSSGPGWVLSLNQDAKENSCRPAVDVLFRSVAETVGGRALAVIMTGMGQDGLIGCEHLRQAGAQILAQDQASSVVWGMPGFVVSAGLADAVLPLSDLGAEIGRRLSAVRR